MVEAQGIENRDEIFRKELEALRPRVRRHCYQMLKHAERAEDATQETLAKAWDKRHTFLQNSPLEHWVMSIATRTSINMGRSLLGRATIAFDEDIASQAIETDATLVQSENKILLEQVFPGLRECLGDQNTWILLQKSDGRTLEEIAETLPAHWKLTVNGIKSRLTRQIKICLERTRRRHST